MEPALDSRGRQLDRLVFVLLVGTLSWGALSFGAVYQWAHRPLLLLALVTGALAWLRRRAPVSKSVAWLVFATLIAIGVQLLALDHATLARLCPATHRVLMETNLHYATAVASGTAVAHPISVAPARTATGLAFLATGAVLALGLSSWLTRERIRQTAAAIAAIGATISFAGVIQRAVSPSLIYGVWQPEDFGEPFGPFVNRNHFAGWIVMGLSTTLGLAAGLLLRPEAQAPAEWPERLRSLVRPERTAATAAIVVAFVMAFALLLSLSRSGIASLVLAIVAGLLVASGRRSRALRKPATTVALLVGAALLWVGPGLIATRFSDLDAATFEKRTGMWRDATRIARDAPWTGVGIRAYPEASLVYQSGLSEFHVASAHSDWLQLVAEGGVLVGIPGLLLLAALVGLTARRFREHHNIGDLGVTYWIRAGAATGLIAIGLQSLVEFSLQMPGNTMLFAVLWAIALAPAPLRRRQG